MRIRGRVPLLMHDEKWLRYDYMTCFPFWRFWSSEMVGRVDRVSRLDIFGTGYIWTGETLICINGPWIVCILEIPQSLIRPSQ